MSDRVSIAIIAGILGSIIQTVLSYLIFLFGISKTHYLMVAGAFFLRNEALQTPAGYLVGFMADITAGGFFALIFVYFLSITGKDYWVLKALGYAGFVWIAGIGLMDRVLNLVPVLQTDPITNLALLVSDVFYSLSMAFFVVRWGKFPNKLISGN